MEKIDKGKDKKHAGKLTRNLEYKTLYITCQVLYTATNRQRAVAWLAIRHMILRSSVLTFTATTSSHGKIMPCGKKSKDKILPSSAVHIFHDEVNGQRTIPVRTAEETRHSIASSLEGKWEDLPAQCILHIKALGIANPTIKM